MSDIVSLDDARDVVMSIERTANTPAATTELIIQALDDSSNVVWRGLINIATHAFDPVHAGGVAEWLRLAERARELRLPLRDAYEVARKRPPSPPSATP